MREADEPVDKMLRKTFDDNTPSVPSSRWSSLFWHTTHTLSSCRSTKIISMFQWVRPSGLSIKNSHSLSLFQLEFHIREADEPVDKASARPCAPNTSCFIFMAELAVPAFNMTKNSTFSSESFSFSPSIATPDPNASSSPFAVGVPHQRSRRASRQSALQHDRLGIAAISACRVLNPGFMV